MEQLSKKIHPKAIKALSFLVSMYSVSKILAALNTAIHFIGHTIVYTSTSSFNSRSERRC